MIAAARGAGKSEIVARAERVRRIWRAAGAVRAPVRPTTEQATPLGAEAST